MRKNISMTIALLCMVVQTAWAQFSGGSGTQADNTPGQSWIETFRVSRWDRYLGMTAAMTQVPVPTAILAAPHGCV